MLLSDIFLVGTGDKLWERRFFFPRVSHTRVSDSLLYSKRYSKTPRLWVWEERLSCLGLSCTRSKVFSASLVLTPTLCFYLQSWSKSIRRNINFMDRRTTEIAPFLPKATGSWPIPTDSYMSVYDNLTFQIWSNSATAF